MKLINVSICILLFFLPVFSIYPEADNSRSFAVIINEKFRGEQESAERIKLAAKALNWKAEIIDITSFNDANCKYDWIITMVPGKGSSSLTKDYLFLSDPERHYFENNGHLMEMYNDYAGYLTTYDNIDLLRTDIRNKQKIYPKRWYPSVQYHPYQKVNPAQLFHFIGHWGDRRNNERYKTLQNELAKKDYSHFFGYPEFGKIYGDAFKGAIPYDGESVIKIISELGVCLVLHSNTHIKHEIPSGKIFEAVAASAVVISDLNPFVMKHFGDSVLYIDQELTGEEMFAQIDAHMNWIQSHPEEALRMAKRAHKIFEDNFLLESQLLDLEMFHSN